MKQRTAAHREFTPQLLGELLAASPEGFFHQDELADSRLGTGIRAKVITAAEAEGKASQEGEFVFDPARLSADQVRERSQLFRGSMPPLSDDGEIAVRSVVERSRLRDERVRQRKDPALLRLLQTFEGTAGYLTLDMICTEPDDGTALAELRALNVVKRIGDMYFDPLRITRGNVEAVQQRRAVRASRDEIVKLLVERPGQTAPRSDLVERFGGRPVQMVIDASDLAVFRVPTRLGASVWVRLPGADAEAARVIAVEAIQPKDEDWQLPLDLCGDVLKPNAQEGESRREKVVARSYSVVAATHRLAVRRYTLETAISSRLVSAFVDPDGQTRIPAIELQSILGDPTRLALVEDLETIRIRELRIAFNEPNGGPLTQKLRNLKRGNSNQLCWGQIRSILWDPPISLMQFRELYRKHREAWLAAEREKQLTRRQERESERQRERARREEERHQREELRARLLAAFPAWRHPGRVAQRILFHVGPTNSGKTHDALDALSEAGTGWYLAPLRLLAFEVFERLNRRGVRCNLLTGEEFIPMDGATITAATIEMFNPEQSGQCVVIDEAQMLADPDRGWAWTRALMEAQSPEIRVMGPPSSQTLIRRLANAAAIPLQEIEHQRLAPLEVSSKPWPLVNLPDRTILVAFSRRIVLQLKAELEKYQRRVSVVYGNLPPEVRRKQADRFADGQTEICVATDAVGMGLNLPADQVCFFELAKFDGKQVRQLTPAEVHQIGGRAGRFGMSQAGLVGATTRRDLNTLKSLYAIQPLALTHARVAPVVEDLAMIPGSLAHRFARWQELQSIPDTLRDVIKPADIDERIALAQRLTDAEVDRLGLATAVQLVNAPTREASRDYWYLCARTILAGLPMPMPPEGPYQIENAIDLETTEEAITCADIYLWLGSRREFYGFAPNDRQVRAMRTAWSMAIDAALLRDLDTAARCINCRKRLPFDHRFTLCDSCYQGRTNWWY